ncbi:MAG TPA: carboxypeptidase regulatory-like domain-containing protein [Acidobacteriota bacterium]|nr:carboxypeptidase regulatory-like domain-containing protein [Acidobacteriota bacterium]
MKARIILLSILVAAVFTFGMFAAESKYQVIRVINAGWVKGKVVHASKDMHLPNLETNVDTQVCGNSIRKLEAVNLGPEGQLRNVVVYLKDINAGKEFRLSGEPPVLTQKGCTFEPHVQIVPPYTSVRILNEDNILHGVHAFQNELGTKFVLFPHSIVYPAKTLFNIAMVAERKESFQQLGGPGVVKVLCESHNWMTAYILVLPHPYFAKVDNNGEFTIQDVPPGRYTLVSWHEYFGTLEQPVEVKANQPVTVNFKYSDEL